MRTSTADNGDTITETDDIISVVWSWTSHHDDFDPVEHRLTWIKDEPRLFFETKNPEGRWIGTPVRNDDYRPTSLANARELAHKFIAGGD